MIQMTTSFMAHMNSVSVSALSTERQYIWGVIEDYTRSLGAIA